MQNMKDIDVTAHYVTRPYLTRHGDGHIFSWANREDLSKVSVIGVGMTNRPGVAAKMFEALYENNINMHMVTTSEVKISVLVNKEDADMAVRAIHEKFFN